MKRVVTSAAIVATLISLTGCDLFKKEGGSSASTIEGASEPVVQFGSKTIVSVGDFDTKWANLLKAQQEMAFVVASMPETEQIKVYEQFADHCANEQIVKEYVVRKGIDKTQEYKDVSRQAHEAIDASLNLQAFQNEVYKDAVALVDALGETELRAFYEANREKDQNFQKPPFVKAGAKKEYAKFEEVREAVSALMKQMKAMEMIQERLEAFKKEIGAQVNKECLARFVKKAPMAAPMTTESAPAEEAAAPVIASGAQAA